MKRVVGLILVVAIMMQMNIGVYATDSVFSDIEEGYWAYDNILELKEMGIVDGYTDGKFHPFDTLTVEQFIKMIILIQDYDVRDNQVHERWSIPYLEVAKEEGIIDSIEDFNGLSWNAEITREQMAKMIVIASEEETEITNVEKQIRDNSSIGDEYKEYVYGAYTLGIITGYADGKFYPKKSLSRAEGTTVIMRLHSSEKRIPNGNIGISNPTIEELMASEDAKEEFGKEFKSGNNGYIIYEDGLMMSKDKKHIASAKQSEKLVNLIENLYPTLEGKDRLIFSSSETRKDITLYIDQSMRVNNFKVKLPWDKEEPFAICIQDLSNLSPDIPKLELSNGFRYNQGKLDQLRVICDVLFENDAEFYYDKMEGYVLNGEEFLAHIHKPEIVHWKGYTVEMVVDSYDGFRFIFER